MATCIGDQFPLARNAFYYVLKEADGEFGQQIGPSTNDAEASGGTFTLTHAVAPLSCTMGFDQERSFAETAQGSRARSQDRVITGKQSATWSIETYMDVAAGAVRGPDIHNLLVAALGDSSGGGGSPARAVKFLPKAAGNCLPSLNIVRVVPNTFSETVYGAAVDTFTISASSGEPVKFSFAGSAYDHHVQGAPNLTAGVDYSSTATGSSLVCAPIIDIMQLNPGRDQYGTAALTSSFWGWSKNEDASGGFAYNKVNTAGQGANFVEDTGTFKNAVIQDGAGPDDDPAVTGANLTIAPFYPKGKAVFNTPKPISSTAGNIVLTPYKSDDSTLHSGTSIYDASLELPLTALEISVANNISGVADEAFNTSSFSGFIPGYRDVTGTLSMRVKRDIQGILMARRDLFRKCKVVIQLGDVANRYVEITMMHVELDPSSFEASGQDELTVSVPFKSMVKDLTNAEAILDLSLEWK